MNSTIAAGLDATTVPRRPILTPTRRLMLRESARFLIWILASFSLTACLDTVLSRWL